MLKRFLIFFYLILYVNVFCQDIINIGILDIEPTGITDVEAKTLTDELRYNLVNLNKFSVLERSEMKSILEEQGFQQSGCTTSECAVEAGELLGVQKIIAGSVGKIGSIYTINIRTIDVKTGKIEQSVNEKHDGDIEGLLDFMLPISYKLGEITAINSTNNIQTQNEKNEEPNELNALGNEDSHIEYSQNLNLGVKGGFGVILYDPSAIYYSTINPDIGYMVGGIIRYQFNNDLSLQLEGYYSKEKLIIKNNANTDNIPKEINIELTSFDFPILIRYKLYTTSNLKNSFNFMTGLILRIAGDNSSNYGQIVGVEDFSIIFPLGIDFTIANNISFELRYHPFSVGKGDGVGLDLEDSEDFFFKNAKYSNISIYLTLSI